MPIPAFPEEVQDLLDDLQTCVERIHEFTAHPGSPGGSPGERLSAITRQARLAFNAVSSLRDHLTNFRIECVESCVHDYVLGDYYCDAGDGRTIYEYGCMHCGNTETSWGRLPLHVRIPEIPDNRGLIHRRILQTQPATPDRSGSN